MNETPTPKGSLWDEQQRDAQGRERERQAEERRRLSANDAASRRAALLAPFIQRYAELAGEEKRLAALVDSFVPLVLDWRVRVNYAALVGATDFSRLATARAELQAVRSCNGARTRPYALTVSKETSASWRGLSPTPKSHCPDWEVSDG